MADPLVGKTIARADRPAYDEYGESGLLVLWFTDGTAVKLRGTGYDVDDVDIRPTTAADLDREFVAHLEAQIDSEWSRHEGALRKHHECLQMSEAYGGEDTKGYRDWYQNRFGMNNFSRALKAEYIDAVHDIMKQSSLMTFGGQP